MNVMINGENFKVSDALEDYTRKKLDKLERYLPYISDIWVDLSREHTRRGEDLTIAQITVRHRRGAILRAEEKLAGDGKDSIEAAINLAVDKMYRQIERFKGKRNRKGRERFVATIEELEMAEELPETEEVEVGDQDVDLEEPGVVRRKEIAVIPMSETEAIEQMELLGHNFFVFFNATAGGVNVLYRRYDGSYGVLIPNVG
jgi:putative sigma-54 modulation protein